MEKRNQNQEKILGKKTNRPNVEKQEEGTNKIITRSCSESQKMSLSNYEGKVTTPKSKKANSKISNTSTNIDNKNNNSDNNIQQTNTGIINTPRKISTQNNINLTINNPYYSNNINLNIVYSDLKHQKKSSSTKRREEYSSEGSEYKSVDEKSSHKGQRNYDKDPLKFIRDLAIVLEGSDFCTAVSLEENTKDIFICCNKFGDHYVNTASRTTTGQHELITKVIEDILNGQINLKEFESCKNLLEILYSNIVFHKNKTFSEFEDDSTKPECLKYLFVYFGMVRPTKEIREILKVGAPFAEPKVQDRIMRFVSALRDVLDSDFLKNEIIANRYKFEIKHTCEPNVHAELKIMNHYIQEKIISQDLDFKEMKKIAKVQVILSPSRLPCEACKLTLAKFNGLDYPLRFIYPENQRIQKSRKLILPNFMKKEWYTNNNITTDNKFEKLIQLESVIKKKLHKVEIFDEKPIQPKTYLDSDKCHFGLPVSQFTSKGGSFKRYENEQEINSYLISNVEKELSFLDKQDLDKKNTEKFEKISEFTTQICKKKNYKKNK